MNSYKHLVKINNLKNGGSRLSLLKLVVRSSFTFVFMRPAVFKLLGKNRLQNVRNGKKLFYTVLTGAYDQLNEIPLKLPNWDYLCFTDNRSLTSSSWEIIFLENKLALDPVRLSRHFKINNHLIDSGYDLSIYVDANIRIRGNLDCFVAQVLPVDAGCGVLLHPFLHSLREETEQCITIGKDDGQLLQQQYYHYTREKGFTDRFPHINARMIIRRTGNDDVRRLMETWFEQLLAWSCRDQMAFNYSLSKHPEVALSYIPYWIFRRYFKKMDHR